MKTLEEIFKTNPKLLDEPEVKELIAQSYEQYKKIFIEKFNYWDKVSEVTLNSEGFVKKGVPYKEAVEKIHQLSFPD